MTGQGVEALARLDVPYLDPGIKRGTTTHETVFRFVRLPGSSKKRKEKKRKKKKKKRRKLPGKEQWGNDGAPLYRVDLLGMLCEVLHGVL